MSHILTDCLIDAHYVKAASFTHCNSAKSNLYTSCIVSRLVWLKSIAVTICCHEFRTELPLKSELRLRGIGVVEVGQFTISAISLLQVTTMGIVETPFCENRNEINQTLLTHSEESQEKNIPKDTFNLAYIIFFTLGAGHLLPWNAFITAFDYFSYLYPDKSVNRTFAVAYLLVNLFVLLIIMFSPKKTRAYIPINTGLSLFILALLGMPFIDVLYVKGQRGLYGGFFVTVGAVGLAGLSDGLVYGGLVGSAGELPKRYMQALVAGSGASGIFVSLLRILTKALFSRDVHGLRNSAILHFIIGIVLMTICLVLYNVVLRLPVIKYYEELKKQAVKEQNLSNDLLSSLSWDVMLKIKYYGVGIVLIYAVTLSITPGFITEELHSAALENWYPVLLVGIYYAFDLLGKILTSIYLLENVNVSIVASCARLLFYPLFVGCLPGSQLFSTEVPAVLLTCLLGLTNGYFSSNLIILAPKAVKLQHAETAGTLIVLCITVGLAAGSVSSWFWVKLI